MLTMVQQECHHPGMVAPHRHQQRGPGVHARAVNLKYFYRVNKYFLSQDCGPAPPPPAAA